MNSFTFNDGTAVLRLGLGTWAMGDSAAHRQEEIRALQTGLDLGMSVIDTAEMYGDGRSELLVGEAIAGRRDEVFLISKVLPSNATFHGILQACERSLQRLKTDYLYLYFLHWQGRYPFEYTVRAMQQLVQQGKIKRWGVSNMDVRQMEEFFAIPAGDTCATNEILYNLSRRGVEYDLLPWCAAHQMPVIAYSPIEQGRILHDRTIAAVAQKHEATPAQIALAWVLRDSNIIAIPKSARPDRVASNFKSLSIQLDDADLVMLDRAFPPPSRKVPLEMI